MNQEIHSKVGHCIHTQTKNQLLEAYAQRLSESRHMPKKWYTRSPLSWMQYKERLFKEHTTISGATIRRVIKGHFPDAVCLIWDWKYSVCSRTVYEEFLEMDDTDKLRYVDEFYDCDDFAFRLMGQLHTQEAGGFAHGIAASAPHAFNILVDWSIDLWIVEPQNDRLLDPRTVDDTYKIEMVLM